MLHIHTLLEVDIQLNSLSFIHVGLLGSALTDMYYSTQNLQNQPPLLNKRERQIHRGGEVREGKRAAAI